MPKNIIYWLWNNSFLFSLSLLILIPYSAVNIAKKSINNNYSLIMILIIGLSIWFYWDKVKEISKKIDDFNYSGNFISFMMICYSSFILLSLIEFARSFNYDPGFFFFISALVVSIYLVIFYTLLMLDSKRFCKFLIYFCEEPDNIKKAINHLG